MRDLALATLALGFLLGFWMHEALTALARHRVARHPSRDTLWRSLTLLR